jgi:TolA-binding protein
MTVRTLPFFLALLTAGCNQQADLPASMTEEELMLDRIKQFEDLGDTLSKVFDERTAKENYVHVQQIESRLKNIKTRLDRLHREKTAVKPINENNRKRMEKSLKAAVDRVIVEYHRVRPIVPAQAICNEVQFTLNQHGMSP